MSCLGDVVAADLSRTALASIQLEIVRNILRWLAACYGLAVNNTQVTNGSQSVDNEAQAFVPLLTHNR